MLVGLVVEARVGCVALDGLDQARRWLYEWHALVDGPPERLVEVFLGEDEHSIDLRQVSPFAGALTDEERQAAIGRASSTHAPH